MEPKVLLPLFPLSLVILPGERIPLHIFEQRYKSMIADCRDGDAEQDSLPFGISYTIDGQVSDIGCSVSIVEVQQEYDDGRLDILIQGEQRYTLDSIDHSRSYYQGWISYFDDPDTDEPDEEMKERTISLHALLVQKIKGIPPSFLLKDNEYLSYVLGRSAGMNDQDKQTLLEMTNENARLHFLCSFYENTLSKLNDAKDVTTRIKANGFLRKLTSQDIQ